MISKDHTQRRLSLLPTIGTIGQLGTGGLVERLSEHAVVGRGPFEAHFSGDGQGFIGNRTFGGPEPDGGAPEFALYELARSFQLMTRVAGVEKPAGKWHAGMRNGSAVGVANQRK